MSKPVGSMSGALLARQLSGRSTSTSGSPTYYHQSSFRLSPARGPRNASRSLVVLLAGPAAQQPSPQKQIELPSADFARIKKSEFISSSVDLKGCPPQTYPEFAVIGRSNVGKSSLINMLTQNSKLAKVSKEPGMTKTINHFLMNDSWYLVDLPGYGYAKTAGKAARSSWLDFTKDYFMKRRVLVAVLLLVDASIPPQQIDLDCANWLAEAQVPFCIVFTKCDARKKGGPTPGANIKAFKADLLKEYEELPACFESSAAEGLGRAEVLNYLAQLRKLDKEQGG